jgi:hypothetical protein
MEDWQRRVIEERAELSERITKFAAFLSKGAPGAPDWTRRLLRLQRNAMLEYSDALNDRIALFEDTGRKPPIVELGMTLEYPTESPAGSIIAE